MTMTTKDLLFKQLKEDIQHDPPIMCNITKLMGQFVEGLCKFCPSKHDLNQQIKSSFPPEPTPESTPLILAKLVFWIEKFQSSNDDPVTKQLLARAMKDHSVEGIIAFLSDYYDHTEKVYKEVWEARQRLVNGEDVVPPQHIKQVQGKDGVPFVMKTGGSNGN